MTLIKEVAARNGLTLSDVDVRRLADAVHAAGLTMAEGARTIEALIDIWNRASRPSIIEQLVERLRFDHRIRYDAMILGGTTPVDALSILADEQ